MKNPLPMLALRMLLAVLFIGFGANSLLKAHRVSQDGVVTQAVITYVSTGKPAYQYRFLANGQYYFGFVHDRHSMGETIEVKYVPDDPSINKATVTTDIDPGLIFLPFGLIWTVFSVAMLIRGSGAGKSG